MAIEVRAYPGNVVETGTGNSGARAVLNVTNITTSGNGKQYSYECYLEVTKGDWYGTNFNINWAPWQSSNPHQVSIGNRLYVGKFTTGIIAWGNTITLSCSAVYNKHGKVTTVSISEQVDQPWQYAVDYAGTNGFAGWVKGPSIYTKVLHFCVAGIRVGVTDANIYRADVGGNYGFNFTTNLYDTLKKEGTFQYTIYAITSTGSNPPIATGDVTVKQITNPVKVTSISAGNDSLGWGNTYRVLSNSSGKVTGDSLSDLKYRVQIDNGGYSEEFKQYVVFDDSTYTLHELSSVGDNYLFETDSSMATDSILNYLQKGLLAFPVTVETSISAASKDIVNTYNYDTPTIVDFNKLYEEEVRRNIRRLDDGTTSVTFAIKYPKSYTLSTVVPDKVTINDIDYAGAFTVKNLGDNLLSFNTIIPASMLGEEDRGTFSAEFSDNISSVQLSFNLPAMYDNDIVIGRKKVGIPAVGVDYTSTSKTDIDINSFDDVTTDSISLFDGYSVYKNAIPRNTASPFDKSYYKIGTDSAVIESALESQRHTIKINGTEIERVEFNNARTNKDAEAAPYNNYPISLPNYQESVDIEFNSDTAKTKQVSGNFNHWDDVEIYGVCVLADGEGNQVEPVPTDPGVLLNSSKITEYYYGSQGGGETSVDWVIDSYLPNRTHQISDWSIPEGESIAVTTNDYYNSEHSTLTVSQVITSTDTSKVPVGAFIVPLNFSLNWVTKVEISYAIPITSYIVITNNYMTGPYIPIIIPNSITKEELDRFFEYVATYSYLPYDYATTSFESSEYKIVAENVLEQYVAHLKTVQQNNTFNWDIICYPIDEENTYLHYLYSPTEGLGKAALPSMEILGTMTHTIPVVNTYNIVSNDYYNNGLPNIKFSQVLDSDLEEIYRGDLIATSTSGITEVHYEFNEPAEESDFIYCQCKEFIEGDEAGFSAPANVLAKEFIEDAEDNNVYIGKNKTQFNELIEV